MLLEVRDIWVHYGGAEAVRGASFDVGAGSITALLGANGAGKSSILRCISGLKRPSSGEIWFMGERIDGRRPARIVQMGIAHCPEGRRLFPYMSVRENLQMGAYLRNDTMEIDRELGRIYEEFPFLKQRSRQKAGTLSGGEQEVLAVARALIARPTLLILDEPSMGLSPMLRAKLQEIIRRIQESGVSVLLVEQDLMMTLRLAYYAYVLEMGEVRLQGEAQELLANSHVREAYLG
jgi:branched-chain amino acid transport system ATP-binding protein